jgi:hypothetical protein
MRSRVEGILGYIGVEHAWGRGGRGVGMTLYAMRSPFSKPVHVVKRPRRNFLESNLGGKLYYEYQQNGVRIFHFGFFLL